MKSVSHIQRNPHGHWVGDGFPVRSIFSYNDNPVAFSPFLLLDFGGPTTFDPTTKRRGPLCCACSRPPRSHCPRLPSKRCRT